MSGFRGKLTAREDQGRFWWELRPCAYYDAFDRPKIVYQVIQYNPAYCLDADQEFLNDKGFMIGSAEPFLLATLNSPLLWWLGWRYFPHMKDEALNPAGFKMERLPIARPTPHQADRAADLTARLKSIHDAQHTASAALADWLRVQWGIANAPGALTSPFGLSPDAFAEALRRVLPKKHKMTVAEVAAAKAEHVTTVDPIAVRLNQATGLERELSAVVNQAYGLTKEEEALVWQTAPPRMPISPPDSEASASVAKAAE
jgi:hypothetical protein